MEKFCKNCEKNIELNEENFYKTSIYKGRQYFSKYCKLCSRIISKAWIINNIEKVKKYKQDENKRKKEFRKNNPGVDYKNRKGYIDTYRENNKEKINSYYREYFRINKDKYTRYFFNYWKKKYEEL